MLLNLVSKGNSATEQQDKSSRQTMWQSGVCHDPKL